jgi:phosphatidate cytidylyltransferase
LLFVTAVLAVAAWEWGALMRLGGMTRIALSLLLAVLCAGIGILQPAAVGLGTESEFRAAAWRLGAWFFLPATFFWVAIVPVWLNKRWSLATPVLGLGTGLLLLMPAWLALLQLRQAGPTLLLAVMMIVWLADTGAYFAGRRFGKHKLAPAISPGKTWEGAIGGGIAVVAYGFLMSSKLPAVLTENSLLLLLLLVAVTAISIIGDLFESLLKRQAGLKDSSAILPGLGGMLDRIDSLTSTLPFVAMIWLMATSR